MGGGKWMKAATRAASCTLTALLCLILAANGWLMISRLWLGKQIPSVLGFAPIYVLSGSMEPTFSAGDMILIHKSPQYKPGDVVTFWSGGELVTHRIIGEGPDGFIVKGDANNVRDEETIREKNIEGKVVAVLPFVWKIREFFRRPQGILLLVFAVLLSFSDRTRKKHAE